MICARRDDSLTREGRRLLGSHRRYIASRTDDDVRASSDLLALTFRPGDHTNSFYGKTLRPAGEALAVVLTYDEDGDEITMGGIRGYAFPDGQVAYGADGRREFQYDVRLQPGNYGPRQRLSVQHKAAVLDLALRMDRLCQRAREGIPSVVPVLPRILLGFPTNQPPQYTESAGLNRLAADRAGISLRKLLTNPPELREQLLRQTWEQALGDPAAVDPQTGLLLVDAEICSPDERPLWMYEDFRGLVGDWTWNPARGLNVVQQANPAHDLLLQYGIDPRGGFQEEIAPEVIQRLLTDFRTVLGESENVFDDEDLFDALVTPDEPVRACSILVSAMRKRLTSFWSETATDFDLRQAAKRPDDALFASGACRMQVLRRREEGSWQFGADDLQRRIDVDFRPIAWPKAGERFARHELVSA